LAEKLITKDMHSAIDSKLTSFIGNKKELMIPKLPVTINQNKNLILIWLEAKAIYL
jgi:hypothetical protein